MGDTGFVPRSPTGLGIKVTIPDQPVFDFKTCFGDIGLGVSIPFRACCFLIYILATLGLRCCMQAFSSCSEGCLLLSCGAQASLIAETGSRRMSFSSSSSGPLECGLSCWGPQA